MRPAGGEQAGADRLGDTGLADRPRDGASTRGGRAFTRGDPEPLQRRQHVVHDHAGPARIARHQGARGAGRQRAGDEVMAVAQVLQRHEQLAALDLAAVRRHARHGERGAGESSAGRRDDRIRCPQRFSH
jgi:hypothetical protein